MSVVSFKCKNCGGELLFDPDSQKFHCEYCDSYFTREELGEEPESKTEDPAPRAEAASKAGAAQREDEFSEGEVVEYTCPSCGAQVIAEASTAATWCYYCHNPVVLSSRLSNKLKPNKVIPFVLDKEQAEKAFEQWKKKKWFLKPGFSREARLEKMSGVYYPYWRINCRTQGHISGNAEKIRTWRSGDTEYTETERYQVVRRGQVELRDITFTAINREDIDLTQGVYPFDYSKAQEFSMAYLSGFLAERRMTETKDVRPRAQEKIRGYTREKLEDTVKGYTHFTVRDSGCQMEEEKWEYVLLPAWVMTYQYNGETYYYAVNGQTGKTCGRLPLSKARLAALFAGVTAVAFGVFSLIGGLLL